jgi:hypothetical protein
VSSNEEPLGRSAYHIRFVAGFGVNPIERQFAFAVKSLAVNGLPVSARFAGD